MSNISDENKENVPAGENEKNDQNNIRLKKPFIVIAALLVIGIGVVFYNLFFAEEEAVEEISPPLVDAKEVQRDDLQKVITLSGNVAPDDQRMIIPQVAGEVDEIMVEEGEDVSAGDVLFTIDDTNQSLQLQEAQAARRAAQASLEEAEAGARDFEVTEAETGYETALSNFEQTEREFERIEELHDSGFVSDQELEQMEMQLKSAEEQLKAAESAVEAVEEGAREEQLDALRAQVQQADVGVSMARENLENTRVTASADGRVASVEITEGDLIGSETPGVILLGENSLMIETNLPGSYVNDVAPGDIAEVWVPAVSDDSYENEILHIGDLPPEGSRSYPMEINLSNEEGRFRTGMHAEVDVVVAEREDVLTIPRYALVEHNGERGVYVVAEDNVVEFVEIETGISEDGVMEIVSGISDQDVIVTDGQTEIAPGEGVEVNRIDAEDEGGGES